jgi:hypothetical protein
MSYGEVPAKDQDNDSKVDEDSKVDAVAAILIILIAVAGMIYWVSNQ